MIPKYEWKPGDFVRLRHPGKSPAMTVSHFTADGLVCCWYFDTHGDLYSGEFSEGCLEAISVEPQLSAA